MTTFPYTTLNSSLRDRFGCRVYKVSVDGGFSCPNRDGTKGRGGCIFCDGTGSSSRTQGPTVPIAEQVKENIIVRRSRYKAGKYIVYFQSFTNTYAPLETLKKRFDEALAVDPDIVGLAVSTRPDCIDREKIELLASYKEKLPYVSIEYGMQTIHDKTLKQINRCMTHKETEQAISLTKEYDLDYCIHTILGLPGESHHDMMQTAEWLAREEVKGVKIHLLVAMEDTPLAHMYREQRWSPLSFEDYVSTACDCIERLYPKTIIHRVAGNGHPLHVVAPRWVCTNKAKIRQALLDEFSRRQSCQGSAYTR